MKRVLFILGVCHLAFVCGFHFEFSRQLISDVLTREAENLDAIINEEWTKEELPYKISFQYSTIATKPSKDTRTVEMELYGSLNKEGEQPITFSADASFSQVVAPEYSIFKNNMTSNVEIRQITDAKLKEALQSALSRVANNLLDWTHKTMHKTSGFFHIVHFFMRDATRIAGSISSDDKAVYIDASAYDIHFSTIQADSSKPYESLKGKGKYFGLSIADKVLDDFIHESQRRRKNIDVRKTLGYFPDFDPYLPLMKLEKLDVLFPDVTDVYSKDAMFNLFMNPKDDDDQTMEALQNENLVVFKKNAIELALAFTMQMYV